MLIFTGFNPTFGPTWVNLYGSPQNSALRDVHKVLNEGLGDGIFYRGRLLMAISVEIFSTIQAAEKKPVEVLKGALSKFKLKKKSKTAKEKAKVSFKEQHQNQAEVGIPEEAEQPSEVIVEVEELHPLPEVSLILKLINRIIAYHGWHNHIGKLGVGLGRQTLRGAKSGISEFLFSIKNIDIFHFSLY